MRLVILCNRIDLQLCIGIEHDALVNNSKEKNINMWKDAIIHVHVYFFLFVVSVLRRRGIMISLFSMYHVVCQQIS